MLQRTHCRDESHQSKSLRPANKINEFRQRQLEDTDGDLAYDSSSADNGRKLEFSVHVVDKIVLDLLFHGDDKVYQEDAFLAQVSAY